MCGRFTLFEPDGILSKEFGAARVHSGAPSYNFAPSRPVAVVRISPVDEVREIARLRWGLIPSWSKDPSIGSRLINARAETVSEKPAFRSAFRHRRCLVPADGFYEWRKLDRTKQPFYIRMRDGRPFAFCGLWERWETPGGEAVETCTILTTDANDVIKPLHDRMPVILPPGKYDAWLDAGLRDPETLASLLRPFDPKAMDAYPVSTLVNNPGNDGPECIRPASP